MKAFGSGEKIPGSGIERASQSRLLHEPNFMDMCRKAETTTAHVLALLNQASAEGKAAQAHIEHLVSEYNAMHPQRETVLKGGAIAVGRAVLGRAQIERTIIELIQNMLSHTEQRDDM